MPIVTNPSNFNLYCEPADTEIRARDSITVSDEVAAKVSRCVFVVIDAVPATPEKATPTRKTTTRGAKAVEVTEAPEVETR